MRIKVAKITFLVVFLNIIALYYSWKLLSKYTTNISTIPVNIVHKPVSSKSSNSNKHLSKSVTIVLRNFDLQENDVTQTAESILNVFPNIQILILTDEEPYPPFELVFLNSTLKNVKIINLSFNINVPFKERHPIFNIRTKYALFIPDSTRITSRQLVHQMVSEVTRKSEQEREKIIVAVPFANAKNVQCWNLVLNSKEWTLKYDSVKNDSCDMISGKHSFLLDIEVLKNCGEPFMEPFPQALYIQTKAQDIKIKLLNHLTFHNGKPLQRSHHTQGKYKQIEEAKKKAMYDKLGIKRVLREKGGSIIAEWFGCNRDTPRCFGTVLDSMPSYLYQNKWTPPCCLANLRNVARYVFDRLDEYGVRYWLDGGSLLGAMRNSDILPWDYDVDIGINRDDISRCDLLAKAKNRPFTDQKGYVWEKATEGEFFRIQFSKTNRIYVNIFPFFSKNGTMTKDMWFTSHKHMEFPDHFLHPMSSIEFINRHVPSPNNIRDFLELKYGKNVIEHPQYPNPHKLKFKELK